MFQFDFLTFVFLLTLITSNTMTNLTAIQPSCMTTWVKFLNNGCEAHCVAILTVLNSLLNLPDFQRYPKMGKGQPRGFLEDILVQFMTQGAIEFVPYFYKKITSKYQHHKHV